MKHKLGDMIEVISAADHIVWKYRGPAQIIGTRNYLWTFEYIILVPKGLGRPTHNAIISLKNLYQFYYIPKFKYLQFDYSHCSDDNIRINPK